VIAILTALGCGTPVDQPVAIVPDREACDACGMLISDPRFEAQLVTRDGDRHVFDDPACAFRFVAEHGPSLAHVWFRDSTTTDEVWLEQRQVAFVRAQGSPMDGGLAAVPLGTEGSLSFGEASHVVLDRASP
jgi:copper chaperone NosL